MSIPVTVNGVKYRSIKQACKVLNKSLSCVKCRLRRGYSIEQAFSLPNLQKTPSCDHLGHIYPTFKDMCQAWGKPTSTIQVRLNKGLDIKSALTEPANKAKGILSKDHLGNKFISIKEMCKFWGINSNTFKTRLACGWDIKKTLTTPVKNIGKGKKSVALNHD